MFFTQCCGSGLIKSEKKNYKPWEGPAAPHPPTPWPAILGLTPKKTFWTGEVKPFPLL